MIRVRALVSGRVQGVFYRDSARRRAEAHGVRGSARNLDDGRVELVLEGDADAVRAVLEWAADGPPNARVSGVERRDEPPLGVDGFTIS